MNEDPEILQERREICRREVRGWLANRLPLSYHPRTVAKRLNEGHRNDFTEVEVLSALAFLVGDGQAEQMHDKLGATLYYKSSPKGVLEHERSI